MRHRPGRGSARAARGSAAGLSIRTRAAASSIARGRPPRRSQIARTAARASSVRTRSGRCERARSTKSATPASISRGGTGYPRSPAIRSSSRLVTSDPELRGGPDDASDRLGTVRQELLEVVQEEQRDAVAQVCPERVAHGQVGRLSNTERGRDGGFEQSGIPDGGQVDEPCAVWEPVADASGEAEGEPRLAAPAWPGQREDPALGEGHPEKLDLGLATESAVTSPGRFDGASSVRSGRGSSAAPGTTSR